MLANLNILNAFCEVWSNALEEVVHSFEASELEYLLAVEESGDFSSDQLVEVQERYGCSVDFTDYLVLSEDNDYSCEVNQVRVDHEPDLWWQIRKA